MLNLFHTPLITSLLKLHTLVVLTGLYILKKRIPHFLVIDIVLLGVTRILVFVDQQLLL